jgi:hypothetical protein
VQDPNDPEINISSMPVLQEIEGEDSDDDEEEQEVLEIDDDDDDEAAAAGAGSSWAMSEVAVAQQQQGDGGGGGGELGEDEETVAHQQQGDGGSGGGGGELGEDEETVTHAPGGGGAGAEDDDPLKAIKADCERLVAEVAEANKAIEGKSVYLPLWICLKMLADPTLSHCQQNTWHRPLWTPRENSDIDL